MVGGAGRAHTAIWLRRSIRAGRHGRMWDYDEDEPTAGEVATDRVLIGALLSGVIHLVAG